GAIVTGFSLKPATTPHHFGLLDLSLKSVISDIRDRDAVAKAMAKAKPDLVFHLAAQALVKEGYQTPVETFEANVMGTVHVLEAARNQPSLKGVVIVSSDKCYEIPDDPRALKETDPLGGYDPYSASKGCTEIVTSAYCRSFFDGGKIAGARAGNVIGGGDWAPNRLIPDLVTGAFRNEITLLRSPSAVRPWQHVLDPLSGYLLLGQRLLSSGQCGGESWNFGPSEGQTLKVKDMVAMLKTHLPAITIKTEAETAFHEAAYLALDCEKAAKQLSWKSVLSAAESVSWTAAWYQSFYKDHRVRSRDQLTDYIELASQRQHPWALS
ncbi:MAG: CDP-glucose 4,6-dehydratase, partial [Candidatus Marinamargulisbacteria bacterium]